MGTRLDPIEDILLPKHPKKQLRVIHCTELAQLATDFATEHLQVVRTQLIPDMKDAYVHVLLSKLCADNHSCPAKSVPQR